MKKLLHIGLLLCVAATVTAQEKVLKVYEWKDLAGQIPNSQIISMDGMSVLKIENTNGYSTNITLLTITNAAIIGKTPAFVCEIKTEHKDVMFGLLQLERNFPPLAIGGDEVTNGDLFFDFPLTQFNWYQCKFTVNRSDVYGPPTRVKLMMRFSGGGTIYLRPIKLLEAAKTSSSWWSSQHGSIIGCFGGLIGWLVSKGKARRFVLAATTSSIVLGILLTIAGLVAAILKQPYSVWYALLLPGVILVLVFSLNLHSIQRRYDELEIRRMTSIDTMR